MITVRLRVLLIVLFSFVLIWLIRQVKSKKLDLRYTLSWLLLDFVLLLLSVFPGLLNALSRLLGIYSPVNMIFFLGFCFSLILIYTLTVAVSRQTEEIKRLTQAIALLKKQFIQKKDEDGSEK